MTGVLLHITSLDHCDLLHIKPGFYCCSWWLWYVIIFVQDCTWRLFSSWIKRVIIFSSNSRIVWSVAVLTIAKNAIIQSPKWHLHLRRLNVHTVVFWEKNCHQKRNIFIEPDETSSPYFHDWINKLILKDNTVSYCFTLFICGRPCHLSSFRQYSWTLFSSENSLFIQLCKTNISE